MTPEERGYLKAVEAKAAEWKARAELADKKLFLASECLRGYAEVDKTQILRPYYAQETLRDIAALDNHASHELPANAAKEDK